jgi:hypothetical protein
LLALRSCATAPAAAEAEIAFSDAGIGVSLGGAIGSSNCSSGIGCSVGMTWSISGFTGTGGSGSTSVCSGMNTASMGAANLGIFTMPMLVARP